MLDLIQLLKFSSEWVQGLHVISTLGFRLQGLDERLMDSSGAEKLHAETQRGCRRPG